MTTAAAQTESIKQSWRYPSFPNSLIFMQNVKQEVPLYQVERLKFQYNCITSCECALLVQQMSRKFFHTFQSEKINIPVSILDHFCRYCHCFLIPGLTCTQRLRSRSAQSKTNTVKPRIKNEIVLVCSRCNRKGKTKRGYNSATKRFKKAPHAKDEVNLSSKQNPANSVNSNTDTNSKNKQMNQNKSSISKDLIEQKPKFSFLTTAKQSSSLTQQSTSGGFSFAKNVNSQNSQSKSSNVRLSGDFIPVPSVGLPNLMDIERQKKLEKRRKSS
jgi:RNase P subunit RPR2